MSYRVDFSDGQVTKVCSLDAEFSPLDREESGVVSEIFTSINQLSTIAGKESAESLRRLMDIADGDVPGKAYIAGWMWSVDSQKWITVPNKSDESTSVQLQLARTVASSLLRLNSIDGVRWGSSCARIPSMPMCTFGVLSSGCVAMVFASLREVSPETSINLKQISPGSWSDSSFLLFYRYQEITDEEGERIKNLTTIIPDLSDISSIIGQESSMDLEDIGDAMNNPLLDSDDDTTRRYRSWSRGSSRSRSRRSPRQDPDSDISFPSDRPPPAPPPEPPSAPRSSRSRSRSRSRAQSTDAYEEPVAEMIQDHAQDNLPDLDLSSARSSTSRSRSELRVRFGPHAGDASASSLDDTLPYSDPSVETVFYPVPEEQNANLPSELELLPTREPDGGTTAGPR